MNWHTLETEEIFKALETREHGLSELEATARLKEHGLNKLPEAKADSLFSIFLRQFQSPIIYILLGAGFIVFLMGEAVDASIILAVLVFNSIVGTIQEGRAQNTLLALKKFVATKAVVKRDGKELIISDSEVVPGDILILQEGGKVPADARLITSHNLKIDEAALTGESVAVHKTSEILSSETIPELERKNMLFKGTHMVAGSGIAVVVAVGTSTVIGKIASEIADITTEVPLKANIRQLSRLIIVVTTVSSVILFGVGILTGKTALEMFATVVSVAVSVIPEGLPIAVTLVLATGVWRMGKKNALVKRLQAVEALGQARVIAVDKTGTITKNEMTITKIFVDGKLFDIGGVGYEPKGEVRLNENAIEAMNHPELLIAGKVAAFCANARAIFSPETKSWRITGDPTEASMFVLAEKLGFNKDDLERESPQLDELPFDYNLKYHVTVHKDGEGKTMTVVGAPEVILALSKRIWHEGKENLITEAHKERLGAMLFDISKEGLRVLAFATTQEVPDDLNPKDSALTFIGFFGMKDALRIEVRDATRRALEAGIRVVMITGDHKVTAEAIAKEALIYKDGDKVLTGAEIDVLSDEALKQAIPQVTVYARVSPEHKLRIINAYKARGEIVAMTGDGVNDAPSLVAADLGVSMGLVGTEVAKEASDIVLLDDNFGSIVSAVEEGRSIYLTIKKVVLYLLSTSIGELLTISGAIFLVLPLPLLPAQIIWLNFITDGFFTVALAMEPKEKNLLQRNFEKTKRYMVDSFMGKRMLLMSLTMMFGTLILFNEYFRTDLPKAWTVSLTVLAVFQWFNAWNCRSEDKSVFEMNPFSNIYMVGATVAAVGFQLLAVYHPLFQRFLRTVPLDLSDWLLIIPFAASILLVEETRKLFARRYKTHRSKAGLVATV